MKRFVFLVVALGVMAVVAATAENQRANLLLLDWAAKAAAPKPGVAVLIELGINDKEPKAWPGQATVAGAKVAGREGFRFRGDDKLVEPNGWEVSSHRTAARAANAAARPNQPVSSGAVLHLTEVQPDAALTLSLKDRQPETIILKDILGGQNKSLHSGAVSVRLVSAAAPVAVGKTEDDFPAAAYAPDGTLWVAYISYTLKNESRRAVGRPYDKQPENFRSLHTPEFGDALFLKSNRGGQWSEPIALTGPQEDLVRCGVAAEGDGTVWIAYSGNRNGRYDIYARPVRSGVPGPEKALTQSAAPDLGPVLCTDGAGNVWLACQSWNDAGQARIALYQCQGGQWREMHAAALGQAAQKHDHGNCWHPALAAGPDGKVALVYDAYTNGDFDVFLALIDGQGVAVQGVATSAKFEARPSVTYDGQGRLWIAYEEGPINWGKDFGEFDRQTGNPLYNLRTVRVVCLQDGKLMKPAAEIAIQPKLSQERAAQLSNPRLGIDGQGQLWLSYRQKLTVAFGTNPGTNWLSVARRLEGGQWSPPIDLHHSDGLLDSRPVLLPHGQGVLAIHNTDGRYAMPSGGVNERGEYTPARDGISGRLDNQIYMSTVSLPGAAPEPKLTAFEPGTKDAQRAKSEREAAERIRKYALDNQNKKHRLLRGEFHRHTEISFDGGNDGSLEDLFRYAIDVAAMDWIGDGDHDNGGGREYTWWLVQKLTDAYTVAGHFTPVFTYERSVPYPHGHRNCMFARRGIQTLPRLAQPNEDERVAGIHADDTKMLYRYLHELDGICASHTSATNMGTDWRDNDPVVEPLVEIYQGCRDSYEYPDAPRTGHDPKSNKLPASLGGWQPAGFIVNAFKQKGYRFGFEASSDHNSTHISYSVAIAERHDRAGVVAALKQRHSYGATDDIILDVKSGQHLMGDAFKTNAPPTLAIGVIGTQPLAGVYILKDSEIVETFKPNQKDYRGTWTDPKPSPGVHYYYVRAEQTDGQLAWGSPMWIEYEK